MSQKPVDQLSGQVGANRFQGFDEEDMKNRLVVGFPQLEVEGDPFLEEADEVSEQVELCFQEVTVILGVELEASLQVNNPLFDTSELILELKNPLLV